MQAVDLASWASNDISSQDPSWKGQVIITAQTGASLHILWLKVHFQNTFRTVHLQLCISVIIRLIG